MQLQTRWICNQTVNKLWVEASSRRLSFCLTHLEPSCLKVLSTENDADCVSPRNGAYEDVTFVRARHTESTEACTNRCRSMAEYPLQILLVVLLEFYCHVLNMPDGKFSDFFYIKSERPKLQRLWQQKEKKRKRDTNRTITNHNYSQLPLLHLERPKKDIGEIQRDIDTQFIPG